MLHNKNTWRLKLSLFLSLLILTLNSCEKALMKPDASSDPGAIFEEIWDFADTHYSFFEYKDIDWKEIKEFYKSRIRADMNQVELFDLCADMLYQLKDGHVNLTSSFDRSRNWEWWQNSPENFYFSIIQRHYFKDNQRYIGPFQYLNMGDIIYIYYGSFSNQVSEGNMDLIISNLKDKKGLIIDVRSNGGGSIVNAKNLASRFIDEKKFIGTNWSKTGPGHDDFKEQEVYLEPYDGEGDRYTGNVVVLTNRKSYSATTYFTQYMSVLDNVKLIGDTTGGGGGMPAFTDLPNGWLLRVSSTRFYDQNGVNIESGIPPDIQINIDEQKAFTEKEDPILEKAIEVLKNDTVNRQ